MSVFLLNACTREPIQFSENLKMKILVHFHFSFLLKIENDFSNPSFKIHFSFFRIKENENFSIEVMRSWGIENVIFKKSSHTNVVI